MIYAIVSMNGRYVGDSYDHDDFNVGGSWKEHDLSHWSHHRYIGNSRNGVVEEVGSDTLPGQVRGAGIWFAVQGMADAEDISHAIKEFM